MYRNFVTSMFGRMFLAIILVVAGISCGQNPKIGLKYEKLTVAVDQGRTITDGIVAGSYDWFNSSITEEHYPRIGEGMSEIEVFLVDLDTIMSVDAVLHILDLYGLRPADLQVLLAIGEHYPEKQKAFRIVALGSTWQCLGDYWHVPCLDGDGSRRWLTMPSVDDDWLGSTRFAAVRKEVS